jgi:hypothetical protein
MVNCAFDSASDVRQERRSSLTRRLTYDRELPAALAERLWRGDGDRLFYSALPLQVKDRCKVARHDDGDRSLIVKRHIWGGPGRTLRLGWRESSAGRCARLGWYLSGLGFPTPRPRASLEECLGPFSYRSYLVTDFIQGRDLFRYICDGPPPAAELRYVARQVARIWQRLVELDISHNDTKPENFIVDDQLRVWLIDFEMSRVGEATERRRQRHIRDVCTFLQACYWHRRAAEREVFLDEFLHTPYAAWLDGLIAEGQRSLPMDIAFQSERRPGQALHFPVAR